jgi:hypothetical protein
VLFERYLFWNSRHHALQIIIESLGALALSLFGIVKMKGQFESIDAIANLNKT